MRWSGHRARWQGTEYRCSPEPRPDGLWLRLQDATGGPARVVPAAECDALLAAVTVCRWRGEPWAVVDERSGELLLEHAGGSTPRARELGAVRVDRGVHRRWVPREEVTGLREELTVLALPS